MKLTDIISRAFRLHNPHIADDAPETASLKLAEKEEELNDVPNQARTETPIPDKLEPDQPEGPGRSRPEMFVVRGVCQFGGVFLRGKPELQIVKPIRSTSCLADNEGLSRPEVGVGEDKAGSDCSRRGLQEYPAGKPEGGLPILPIKIVVDLERPEV